MIVPENTNILWVDFLANGERLADEQEQEKLIQNALDSGVTHLIVDAKVPYGQTTYPSKYAYHISSWSDGMYDAWKNRDFLAEFLAKTKGTTLKVLANMDVFSEGITSSRDGMAYDKNEWQVTFYNDAVSSESNAAEYTDSATIFVNPIHPEVQVYEQAIVKEIISSYELDGLIIDRCRYPNIYGDFSDLSREKFESFIGEKVEKWPEDIYRIASETKAIQYGKHFGKWTEWRAVNIKTFVHDVRNIVKGYNSDLLFADYVGSWYPLYYSEGVNWASETYKPNLDWTSDTYHVSGLAEELDFLMTGCYYPEVYVEEAVTNGRPADWYSVEGAANLSLQVVKGSTPVIASLFLKDYQDHPEQFVKAINMCKEKTGGVMLFDAVYLENYEWWSYLPDELKKK
ncbi:family 10 glycosylhydrolase [Aquibacillus sp. 3ASR75-11]|uniref:Family 10 glycosylhydrolase n=1 Tax=Terrihalobacillus insolitus TaxID=2950438 RepID=A0A9X3WTG5_9BACI|nr:alpha amylase family protein [Terrihalobacillus insolitus]MDC3413810.1 family 10 glycosylhydrolase [Terrihalobacillus insolitus]MDC3424543.1 family 10 glycosylhydrolase [Terrihalobacillus insolitus]